MIFGWERHGSQLSSADLCVAIGQAEVTIQERRIEEGRDSVGKLLI